MQFDQFDHVAGNGENTISIDFSSMVEASDYDEDPISLPPGAFVVTVTDDIPAIGPISDGLVDFAIGDFVTNPLSGVVGADDDATYTIEAYTGDDEMVVVNDVELTVDRSPDKSLVEYYFDENGDGQYTDTSPLDELYYTMQIGGGNYTFTVHTDPPPSELEFDFDDLPPGQNLFGMVGDPDHAIIVIGSHPDLDPADNEMTNASDTINTSRGGGPTTIGVNNQMFDPGEDAYFTFVENPVLDFLSGAEDGLNQGEADDADNIQYTGGTTEVDGAFLKISQTQGKDPAGLEITAFDMVGAPQEVAFVDALGTGPQVDVTAVRVYDENDTFIFEATGDVTIPVNGITADFEDGVVDLRGLEEDYKIEWDTDGLHDQVHIAGTAGKFDIGLFGISEPQPTPDQLLAYTVQIEDYDHDVARDTFLIGIDGTGIHDDGQVDGLFGLFA